MTRVYRQVHDGEWLPVTMSGEWVMCCSCGLTHFVKHRYRDGILEECVRRDNRATAAARKSSQFECHLSTTAVARRKSGKYRQR